MHPIDSSVKAFQDAVKENPTAELVFLLVARADWHEPAEQVGFCLSRRTWAHNLFVDYLGTDPRLFRPDARQIGGVGTGLLHTVMALGQSIGAGKCLLEATDESFGFYRKKFRMMELNDLFGLSPAEQWHYMEKSREAWSRLKLPFQLELDPRAL